MMCGWVYDDGYGVPAWDIECGDGFAMVTTRLAPSSRWCVVVAPPRGNRVHRLSGTFASAAEGMHAAERVLRGERPASVRGTP